MTYEGRQSPLRDAPAEYYYNMLVTDDVHMMWILTVWKIRKITFKKLLDAI